MGDGRAADIIVTVYRVVIVLVPDITVDDRVAIVANEESVPVVDEEALECIGASCKK